ncbi:chorismate mutase [Roseovarius sp. 217]|nr:chorismate mutase [Roseovarius sp. 217]
MGFDPTLRLVLLVMSDHLGDDEVQELLGEFRVQIGRCRQFFEPFDLRGFARVIGRGKVVFSLEFPHGLRVFEPLSQREDEDRVKPVDALAVLFQKLGGKGGCVSHASLRPVQTLRFAA